MALPLLAIGEALSQGAAGSARPASKGLAKDVSFGSHLQRKLDGQATAGSDLLSQIAAMIQAGTPMATIIDRVAKTVSAALTNVSGNGGNATRQRTLERALAAALAPPGGTSPPGQTGVEQATALEQRLGTLLSAISREIQNAGQQNRFSGQVLDANSAREIPAQQQTKDAAGAQPDGSLASAESILRNAAQGVPEQNAVQSATDVLGRMLARAANADADVQRTAGNAAPAASPVSAHSTQPQSVSSSDLFTRLIQVIAQSSGQGASHGEKQSQDFAFSKNALATHHASSQTNSTQTPGFATAMTTATASASQTQALPGAPSSVDPQAVIEQVVKGIVMRDFGTTSEVRMRLQPEHLGDVSLKLTVSGNTISANIVAQNADVRDMLMQNQQQLARSLSEAGLALGNFSVDVSGGNPGFSQQQTPQHRSLWKVGALQLDAPGEDEGWADSRFGPPLVSGAKPLVLNYLV